MFGRPALPPPDLSQTFGTFARIVGIPSRDCRGLDRTKVQTIERTRRERVMKGMGPTTETMAGALALLTLSAIVSAQGPGPGGGPGRGPRGPGGAGFGFGGPVQNEPYSATELRSFTEGLANGNSISLSSCAKVYRASSGATRVEDTPNSTSCGSTPAFISITDPSAGVRYEINVQKSTYHQITLRTAPAPGTARSGWPAGGQENGNGARFRQRPSGRSPFPGHHFPPKALRQR